MNEVPSSRQAGRDRVRSLIGAIRAAPAGHVNDILGPGGNAIGFLRFTLAALVVVHHTRILGGFGDDVIRRWTRGQADFGIVAVAGFFALSGLLVTRSALHSSSTIRYLWHRALRVLPGYWVCLLVITFAFGPAFWIREHGGIDGYLDVQVAPPVGYVTNNFLLLLNQTRIDHLLADNPYPFGLDGSLWTLAYEFAWYLVVATLAAMGLLHRPAAVIGLVGLVVAQSLIGVHPFSGVPVIGYALSSRFGLAFSLGMLAYVWRHRIPLDDRLAAIAAAAFMVSLRSGTFSTIGMTALAYGVLWAAWRLPFRKFGTKRDLSYGLYIYAFPVQQTVALIAGSSLGPPLFLVASLAGTLPLAFLSYVFVERPALRFKNARSKHPVRPTPPLSATGSTSGS